MSIESIVSGLAEFIRDEGGQSVVEYSLLLSLISASSVFMATLMGLSIGRLIGVDGVMVIHYTEWAIDRYQER
ncbi:MAG: Flp family type IVb pilin [Acidobacteriota bacterium]|jgi:Flp pilus assembly pilin Flp